VLHAAAGLLVFLVYWHQPELWALKVNPTFHIFDIEGVGRGREWVPSYELKDLENVWIFDHYSPSPS
jgi:hypothetical protein